MRKTALKVHDEGKDDKVGNGRDQSGDHDPEPRCFKWLPLIKDVAGGLSPQKGDPEHGHAKSHKEDADFVKRLGEESDDKHAHAEGLHCCSPVGAIKGAFSSY